MDAWYFDDIPLEQEWTTPAYVVPEDELVAFARRWDPLPIHTDPEAAAASPHGGLIAPATYVMAMASAMMAGLGLKLAVIGGADWKVKFAAPVRPGDRLEAATACAFKRPSRTKPDRGIARFVSTLRNQRGELVLHWESHVVISRRPQPPPTNV